MQEQQKQDLIKLIEPILVKNKVILYNLDYRKDKSNYVLEILIERADGAMDLDTCVQISQELSILLDDVPFLKDEYTLEVASPGVERPLKSLEQFQKALGKYVYIKTKNP
ncbi:MAG: ribosome maturation factor RimP, partial [Bacilli bacterium]|nr:ribosome maturation factor RimP [Bacilli bacterium]